METIKLFYKDSEMKEFEAKVISCEKEEEGYKVLLDQTAFFPEGGGQTADTGILIKMEDTSIEGNCFPAAEVPNQVNVLDVQEEDGLIYHLTDGPVAVGSEVKGKIHWKERFSKMQHHTGEHIVSGLVNRHYGFHNVGFHLGSQVVTLDFDGVLTKEQLRQVEYEANEAVAKNIPIVVTYPSKDELKDMFYRSKIEIEGQVRIVEIPGYDTCACCAPHLKTTGQIGMIKLVNMHNYKGGVRVYMLCGFAALVDYNEKEDSVRTIALSLCAQESQVAERVEKLQDEIYKQKGIIMNLVNELLDYKVAAVEENAPVGFIIDHNLDGNQPRELANKLMDKGVTLAAVFAGADETGYRYVLGSRKIDVRSISKEMNGKLNGRGGGKPEMVQGSASCSKEDIKNFFVDLNLE